MMPLTEQQRWLAEENHGLIITFIQRKHLDLDEYYGDLAETYCYAIASYDESKGKLSTYVFASLGNRLKNIYRAKTFEKVIPTNMLCSIDVPVSADGYISPLVERLPNRGISVEIEFQLNRALERMYKVLSPFESELLNNIIYSEYTQRELAGRYNTSQSSYARWEKAVKNKARQILLVTLI